MTSEYLDRPLPERTERLVRLCHTVGGYMHVVIGNHHPDPTCIKTQGARLFLCRDGVETVSEHICGPCSVFKDDFVGGIVEMQTLYRSMPLMFRISSVYKAWRSKKL